MIQVSPKTHKNVAIPKTGIMKLPGLGGGSNNANVCFFFAGFLINSAIVWLGVIFHDPFLELSQQLCQLSKHLCFHSLSQRQYFLHLQIGILRHYAIRNSPIYIVYRKIVFQQFFRVRECINLPDGKISRKIMAHLRE